MDQVVETEVTGTKKIVAFVAVGTVAALAVAGVFVPSAHDYVVTIAKTIMNSIPALF